MSPYDPDYDAEICYSCGTQLVEINDDTTDEQYFAFEGFCSPQCAFNQLALEAHHSKHESGMVTIRAQDEFIQRLTTYVSKEFAK